jgi:hypothetical protein
MKPDFRTELKNRFELLYLSPILKYFENHPETEHMPAEELKEIYNGISDKLISEFRESVEALLTSYQQSDDSLQERDIDTLRQYIQLVFDNIKESAKADISNLANLSGL